MTIEHNFDYPTKDLARSIWIECPVPSVGHPLDAPSPLPSECPDMSLVLNLSFSTIFIQHIISKGLPHFISLFHVTKSILLEYSQEIFVFVIDLSFLWTSNCNNFVIFVLCIETRNIF